MENNYLNNADKLKSFLEKTPAFGVNYGNVNDTREAGEKLLFEFPTEQLNIGGWKNEQSQNYCLENILESNYDLKSMGIEYGSDDYYKLAKLVMDANPEIYGTEDGGWREEAGGMGRMNATLYNGEKLNLPDYKAYSDDVERIAETLQHQESFDEAYQKLHDKVHSQNTENKSEDGNQGYRPAGLGNLHPKNPSFTTGSNTDDLYDALDKAKEEEKPPIAEPEKKQPANSKEYKPATSFNPYDSIVPFDKKIIDFEHMYKIPSWEDKFNIEFAPFGTNYYVQEYDRNGNITHVEITDRKPNEDIKSFDKKIHELITGEKTTVEHAQSDFDIDGHAHKFKNADLDVKGFSVEQNGDLLQSKDLHVDEIDGHLTVKGDFAEPEGKKVKINIGNPTPANAEPAVPETPIPPAPETPTPSAPETQQTDENIAKTLQHQESFDKAYQELHNKVHATDTEPVASDEQQTPPPAEPSFRDDLPII